MKKVLVITCATENLINKARRSVLEQDYPNYETLVLTTKPDAAVSKCENIIHCHNAARKLALASDADYFAWVDDDIVLPRSALSSLMLQLEQPPVDKRQFKHLTSLFPNVVISDNPKKHIIGGWFRVKDEDGLLLNFWNCGRWVADNTITNLTAVERSVTRVDKIDLGCLLMSREVLEKVSWRGGESLVINHIQHPCICLMFARDAQDAGYTLWMDGSVVCEHLLRRGKWILKLKRKLMGLLVSPKRPQMEGGTSAGRPSAFIPFRLGKAVRPYLNFWENSLNCPVLTLRCSHSENCRTKHPHQKLKPFNLNLNAGETPT
jgi:hypothetical protein